MPSATAEFAGTMNVQLTIEAPGETVASGDASVPWASLGTIWGDVEGLTGLNRGGLTAEAEYRVKVYFRSDITPRCRLGIVGTSRKLGILSVVDPTGRRQQLVILARELLV